MTFIWRMRGADLSGRLGSLAIARQFLADTSGAVAIMAALTLPVLIGFSALALEFGHGLVIRAENQRNADIAAFSAAKAYAKETDSAKKDAAAKYAAKNIASLNGIDPDDVVVQPHEEVDGGVEIRVNITEELPLMLARVLNKNMTGLVIDTFAVARLDSRDFSGACILALRQLGPGITMNGGGAIDLDAGNCGVAASDQIEITGNLKKKFKCISSRLPSVSGNFQIKNYCEWRSGGPFADPHAGKKIHCDHEHGALEVGINGELKSGTHCIDQKFSLIGASKTIFVEGGKGVSLVFRGGASLELGGNSTLNIQAPSVGPMKGILIYAPTSHLDIQTANMNIPCGIESIVAETIHLGGSVDISTSCGEEDSEGQTREAVRLVR